MSARRARSRSASPPIRRRSASRPASPAWSPRRARWCSSPPRPRPRRCCSRPISSSSSSRATTCVLRDDKSFPYILIARGHAAARLVKHRGARSIQGDYFGPFASAGAVFRTMNALQRAFLLRTCSDSYYENRTRPCLLYQIKRCSGPCTGEIALDDYAELVGAGARLPVRPQPGDPPAARRGDERGRRGARIREGGAPARPHLGAVGDPGRAERQSALDSGGRRLRHRRGGGAVSASRCSSSAPIRTGATAPIFRAPTGRSGRRRCSTPSSRSSTSSARRRGSCC